jgi:hypothetical protein
MISSSVLTDELNHFANDPFSQPSKTGHFLAFDRDRQLRHIGTRKDISSATLKIQPDSLRDLGNTDFWSPG